MKRKILFGIISLTVLAVCIQTQTTYVHGNVGGAPTFRSGSPGDGGQTCSDAGCHGGASVITQAGMITSDIPGAGYTPGAVYTFTATVSKSGISKFGFEVSPQTLAGTKLGTLAVTNATETQLIGSSKYITHKSAGTTGSGGSKSWTFSWTAPASGTGTVTFYGCFNAANGNTLASGDQIYQTAVQYAENTTSITTSTFEKSVTIYPIPTKEFAYLSANITVAGTINVSIYDFSGKEMNTENYTTTTGENIITIPVNQLTRGVYFVSITSGAERINKKIVID